jgi:hypothetical protein
VTYELLALPGKADFTEVSAISANIIFVILFIEEILHRKRYVAVLPWRKGHFCIPKPIVRALFSVDIRLVGVFFICIDSAQISAAEAG